MNDNTIHLYLDISCSRCDPLIASITKWGEEYNYDKFEIIEVDHDPERVFDVVHKFRKEGHNIQHLPLLVVGGSNLITGFPSDVEVRNFLHK